MLLLTVKRACCVAACLDQFDRMPEPANAPSRTPSASPIYSYCKLDDSHNIQRIAEKEQISRTLVDANQPVMIC